MPKRATFYFIGGDCFVSIVIFNGEPAIGEPVIGEFAKLTPPSTDPIIVPLSSLVRTTIASDISSLS